MFKPTATWDALRHRAEILEQLRQFFRRRGFLEVETPLLSSDTVVDRFIDPIEVDVGRPMWLQTSPEFCMKRMMAAGAKAIFQICKAFRHREQGTLHNVEFTMCEWYRAGDSTDDGMTLLDELCQELLGKKPAERLSYQAAFQNHVGLDPHAADEAMLLEAVQRNCGDKVDSIESFDRDELLNVLLAEVVEPKLGQDAPTILFDYPASQAALARVRDGNPPVAERFELYVEGMELANGYHELLDANVLRERNQAVNEQRMSDGKAALPEESQLLAAMENGLPDCVGVALGFDRLVMQSLGASSISEVLAFPTEQA